MIFMTSPLPTDTVQLLKINVTNNGFTACVKPIAVVASSVIVNVCIAIL